MKYILFIICLLSVMPGKAQEKDSTFFFRTDLTVTNNGFSIIPAFTLGKPAAYLDMQMGNKRFSFDPMFRFSLKGRPWTIIFIYRYKAINTSRFQLTFGGHLPGINFITSTVSIDGIDEELSVARRFLAGEIHPKYIFSKHASIGLYYLQGHGFQKHGPQNSNFLALQGNFTEIKLVGKSYFTFNPQVFYLKVDDSDGYYVNATTVLGIRNFPLTISGIVNKAIQSTIPAKDFDWSLNLIYTFDKQYVIRRNSRE